ncbi:MAG: DUF2071 domain-containing protein [Candidatus Obscuribacterales bacterium]|nr:DUF2071 domain-containing protein [Candidatus Obscuribacterales bacterium]
MPAIKRPGNSEKLQKEKHIRLDFLNEITHRPYLLPKAPYAMSQVWRNLLFAHWRVDAEELQKHIPSPLEVDTFDGSAWLGVVPFRMCEVKGRFMPFHIDFLELNVRSYVKYGNKRGVYFFSLDADHYPSVWGARVVFGLPYYRAKMSYENKDGVIRYTSKRLGSGPSVEFSAEYEPTGAPEMSSPGTLQHFLTERYCLMISHLGRVLRTDIHHGPWLLAPARADIGTNSMLQPLGFNFDTPADSLLYAGEMKMVNWFPSREIL